jgi:hypothetical protein
VSEANVRFWPKADMRYCAAHVCFPVAALVMIPAVLTQTHSALADPYPWCAQYSGGGGMTVREAVEFRKLKKALQARANPED